MAKYVLGFFEIFWRLSSVFWGLVVIALFVLAGYSSDWLVSPREDDGFIAGTDGSEGADSVDGETSEQQIMFYIYWGAFRFCHDLPLLFNDPDSDELPTYSEKCTGYGISTFPHTTWLIAMSFFALSAVVVVVVTVTLPLAFCCKSSRQDNFNIVLVFVAIFFFVIGLILWPIGWGSGSYSDPSDSRNVVDVCLYQNGNGSPYKLGNCQLGNGFVAACLAPIMMSLQIMSLYMGKLAYQQRELKHTTKKIRSVYDDRSKMLEKQTAKVNQIYESHRQSENAQQPKQPKQLQHSQQFIDINSASSSAAASPRPLRKSQQQHPMTHSNDSIPEYRQLSRKYGSQKNLEHSIDNISDKYTRISRNTSSKSESKSGAV